MQSVAFARPAQPATPRVVGRWWSARLRRIRELGRLALTALVLAVGLGGVTTLPAAAPVADLAHPVVVVSRVDELRPGQSPGAELPADRALPQPQPALPLPRHLEPAALPAAGSVDRPATDPTRDTLARRGPPRR